MFPSPWPLKSRCKNGYTKQVRLKYIQANLYNPLNLTKTLRNKFLFLHHYHGHRGVDHAAKRLSGFYDDHSDVYYAAMSDCDNNADHTPNNPGHNQNDFESDETARCVCLYA